MLKISFWPIKGYCEGIPPYQSKLSLESKLGGPRNSYVHAGPNITEDRLDFDASWIPYIKIVSQYLQIKDANAVVSYLPTLESGGKASAAPDISSQKNVTAIPTESLRLLKCGHWCVSLPEVIYKDSVGSIKELLVHVIDGVLPFYVPFFRHRVIPHNFGVGYPLMYFFC